MEYAVGEALANSAEHGGGAIMTLSCWHDGTKVVVEVSDRGGGFQPTLHDAKHRSNDRGFGLHLMHELADGVEFFDGGRRVRLHREFREDDHVFRNNVRWQSKRRAFREFTRGVTLLRFVQSALKRQRNVEIAKPGAEQLPIR